MKDNKEICRQDFNKKISNRILITLSLLVINCSLILGQELKKDYQKIVANFIVCVKKDKIDDIAKMISYPFNREYPIPTIKDKNEFKRRYNEVFDNTLKQMIVTSNPAKDWSCVGWRGIMLNQGDIWIDIDGRLMKINYQSRFEKRLKNKLIVEDKKKLHSSLSKFYKPLYVFETSKFRIRIDDLGNYKFRYASWLINQPMTNKPDLILNNGQFVGEGSGGNHSYKFKSGEYIYECAIIVMGEKDAPPAMLNIYKADKNILSQKATIIEK